MPEAPTPDALRPVLRRFPSLRDHAGRPLGIGAASLPPRPLAGGLINDTFALGDTHVLQRLHPVFRAEVNLDIRDLTAHLRAAGVPVPRIEEAEDGRPFVEVPREAAAPTGAEADIAGVWRILTRLPGTTLHRLGDAAQAEDAARLVARFHGALLGVDHVFAFTRPGAHDTAAHAAAMRRAVRELPGHRLAADVARIAAEVEARLADLDPPRALPRRIVHGDLKVSNLLFGVTGRACGIIDLDTMAHATLDVELGDALRSWCNRAEEHDAAAHLDPALLRAALRAWLAGTAEWLRPEEARAIAPGLLRITLELTARFAADALRERYFGWDPRVAPSRGEHNLLRARNQLDLARQITDALPGLMRSLGS